MILGIDEVGRGPWAGPLVIGAVILGEVIIEGLADSKVLSRRRRVILDEQIREQTHWGLGWVSSAEIDTIGLSAALRLGTARAIQGIDAALYDEIIIDGTINFLQETDKAQFVTTLPKADSLVAEVSAASIIAKVARDNFMSLQDKLYPGYNFTAHVGYGTAFHRQAIARLGITPLHRVSIAPLRHYRDKSAELA